MDRDLHKLAGKFSPNAVGRTFLSFPSDIRVALPTVF
jgi:hypothetical protein